MSQKNRLDLAWFCHRRFAPGRMPALYLESMKAGEELTWTHLNTPAHFQDLLLAELEPSGSMWHMGSCRRVTSGAMEAELNDQQFLLRMD